MGQLVVISSPSGGGKGTLIPPARKRLKGFGMTISQTTRSPRPGEEHGREYFFVSREQFLEMKAAKQFVESAEVHGNFYGTSYAELERVLGDGHNVLLEIDIQGALQIKERYPDSYLIFIMPPSLEVLEERLRGRGTESAADLAKRLAAAPKEMKAGEDFFDHIVINDVVEDAVSRLVAVIEYCVNPRSAARLPAFTRFTGPSTWPRSRPARAADVSSRVSSEASWPS